MSSKVGRILNRVNSPSLLLGRSYLMCAKLAGESNRRGRTREYCEDDEVEAEAEAEAPPYRGVIAPSFLCACEDCEVGWKTSECALLVCRARGLSSRRVPPGTESALMMKLWVERGLVGKRQRFGAVQRTGLRDVASIIHVGFMCTRGEMVQ